MADLKTIMHITQAELRRQVPVLQAVLEAVDKLKPREADVLRRRYGLHPEGTETLQQIGAEFGVSRERVRQIEAQGLIKFRSALTQEPLNGLVRLAETLIREHGGVLHTGVLSQLFLPESQQTELGNRGLAFLMQQIPSITVVSENRPYRSFYATSKAHQQAVEKVSDAAEQVLTTAKQPITVTELTAQILESPASDGARYLTNEPFVRASLEISIRFVECPGDQWGLASWSDINPRNIRDKTLYVLKKTNEPLHYQDIADHIRDAKFDAKKVTAQAVHNELINGDEFVLIGRGIYALAEWGYIPGTVAEVIRSVLRKAETPLDREAIIAEVLKQRQVSRNTILINLQDKSQFSRVDKTSYVLAGSKGEPEGTADPAGA